MSRFTDVNGCIGISAAETVTVNTNPTPALTPSGATTFCDGGSVDLDADAGFSTYAWSTGASTASITVTTAGSYDVTVTDVNGCIGTTAAEAVTVNANPTPALTPSGTTTFCDGGSVDFRCGCRIFHLCLEYWSFYGFYYRNYDGQL